MQIFPASTVQTLRTRYEIDNVPHFTGATVTVDITGPTNDAVVSDLAATEEGNGYYYVTLTTAYTATKGLYRVVWKGVRSTDCCDIHGKNFNKEEWFQVGSPRPDQISLRELRWIIARLLGDNLVSTASSSSTVSNLVDSMLATKDQDKVAGGWVYIYEGTNSKLPSRRVTAFSNTTATVTPAYSSALDATSKYELHRKFSVEDYNNAIELAIRSVGDVWMKDIDDNTTMPSDGIVTIPDRFDWIYLIKVVPDENNDWQQDIRPTAWDIVPGQRKLRFGYDIAQRYYTYALHIYGLTRPEIPVSDNQTITVPIEFVIKEALSNLLTQLMGSTQTDTDANTQQRQIFKQEAEFARTKLKFHAPPNVKRV